MTDDVPTAASPLPFRRKLLYGVTAFVLVVVVAAAGLLALDIVLRRRAQAFGLNAWGYRGPTVGRKHAGELRIAALVGSTVFGYGLPWQDAWPRLLEQRIDEKRPGATVVNLGVPRDSAATFVATLDDYAYLQSDVVIFYEGYNDLETRQDAERNRRTVANYLSLRHQSPIFRWTGYLPVLPLVLNEKAMALTHGGDVAAGYGAREIVFQPGLAARATAGALKATADIEVALEERFGKLTDDGSMTSSYDDSCGRWSRYCGAVLNAVRVARQRGERVVVAGQPYLSDLHVDQQTALEASIRREFGGDPGVRYVGLGRLVDLHDPQLAYDGLHLTRAGNDRVAAALAPVVLAVIQ